MDIIKIVSLLYNDEYVSNLNKKTKRVVFCQLAETVIWSLSYCKYYDTKSIDDIKSIIDSCETLFPFVKKVKYRLFVAIYKILGKNTALRLISCIR